MKRESLRVIVWSLINDSCGSRRESLRVIVWFLINNYCGSLGQSLRVIVCLFIHDYRRWRRESLKLIVWLLMNDYCRWKEKVWDWLFDSWWIIIADTVQFINSTLRFSMKLHQFEFQVRIRSLQDHEFHPSTSGHDQRRCSNRVKYSLEEVWDQWWNGIK
jgi:hypothetical protein